MFPISLLPLGCCAAKIPGKVHNLSDVYGLHSRREATEERIDDLRFTFVNAMNKAAGVKIEFEATGNVVVENSSLEGTEAEEYIDSLDAEVARLGDLFEALLVRRECELLLLRESVKPIQEGTVTARITLH